MIIEQPVRPTSAMTAAKSRVTFSPVNKPKRGKTNRNRILYNNKFETIDNVYEVCKINNFNVNSESVASDEQSPEPRKVHFLGTTFSPRTDASISIDQTSRISTVKEAQELLIDPKAVESTVLSEGRSRAKIFFEDSRAQLERLSEQSD